MAALSDEDRDRDGDNEEEDEEQANGDGSGSDSDNSQSSAFQQQDPDNIDNDDDDDSQQQNILNIPQWQEEMTRLASSRPDVGTMKQRAVWMQQAMQLLQQFPEARHLMAEWYCDIQCSSPHSSRRVVRLLTYSISLELGALGGGDWEGSDDDIQGAQDDEHGISNQNRLLWIRIQCRALAHVLDQAGNPAFVDTARQQLMIRITAALAATAEQGDPLLRITSSSASSTSTSSQNVTTAMTTMAGVGPVPATRTVQHALRLLTRTLLEIAETTPLTLSAVALGAMLAAAPNDDNVGEGQRNDKSTAEFDRDYWIPLLLKHSLTTHFGQQPNLALARNLLQRQAAAVWATVILPALLLKIKSHPDKALPSVHGWIAHMPLCSSIGEGLSTIVEERVDDPAKIIPVEPEWIQVLLHKHLIPVSSSSANGMDSRAWARQIIADWARQSTSAWTTWAEALAAAHVPLAPARLAVYETLQQLAELHRKSSTNIMGLPVAAIEHVIHGLITNLLPKDTSSSAAGGAANVSTATTTISSNSKSPPSGQGALVAWMVLAKRRKESKGYAEGLSLWQKSILAKNAAETGHVLALLVQQVHPDFLESIITDLWMPKQDKNWDKGLEGIVDAAASKKSIQVDALLVVYVTLVYAFATKQAIPLWAEKVLSPGSSTKTAINAAAGSFLYAKSMVDLVTTNPLASMVLARCLSLFTQIVHAQHALTTMASSPPCLFSKQGKISAAARVWALCVMHPTTMLQAAGNTPPKRDLQASHAMVAILQTILTYEPRIVEGLVEALLDQVNMISVAWHEMVDQANASREARENESFSSTSSIKGQGSHNASHHGYDANTVRKISAVLARHVGNSDTSTPPVCCTRAMILLHLGTSLKSEGHQRAALMVNTQHVLRDVVIPLRNASDKAGQNEAKNAFLDNMADELTHWASNYYKNSPERGTAATAESPTIISASVHEAALSFLLSMGGLSGNFSPDTGDPDDEELQPYSFCHALCTREVSRRLSSRCKDIVQQVDNLSVANVDLYLSPKGTLFQSSNGGISAINETKKTGANKRLSEEDEWEMQIKKELEEKKRAAASADSGTASLSAEDIKMIAQQDQERTSLGALVKGDFERVMDSISFLCASDIEVGNSCLPIICESVLLAGVSISPAMQALRGLRNKSQETLKSLAACVYEIDEVHAPTLVQALLISSRKEATDSGIDPARKGETKEDSNHALTVSPLPSPCAPAACAIYEMDQFHDALSGPSFFFLFPIVRACLMGQRTPTGCEAALRVLDRHTGILSGDARNSSVVGLRKDMVITVLELLRHDRAQTFHDPTPFETLTRCFETSEEDSSRPPLSTAELAPLLDDRGALGPKNCRIGAMLALARIAEVHRKLVKLNPLMENRIWVNCFDADEEIRSQARRTWAVVHDLGEESDPTNNGTLKPPSPLYGASLLPLLSHTNKSIAQAASDAYAFAMGLHPKSVSRNIEVLCKTYIEAFPTPAHDTSASSSKLGPTKNIVAATSGKKKGPVMSTGLPKKKATTKKSPLDIAASIGKPKVAKKKTKSTSSDFLKPKTERTLDSDDFAGQFLAPTSKKEEGEKDTSAKVEVRLGVLRAITSVTSSASPVEMDEATLKLLTSFLMAYGIADSSDEVKSKARDTLRDVVASNGGSDQAIAFLLTHLEAVLKTGVADEESLDDLPKDKVPKDVAASDRRKEGAVVALGSVAIHLKGVESDEKVHSTVDMLLAALKTPSEDVQHSVADALTKLMKKGRTQDRIESILSDLVKQCLQGDTLAARRGSAYGLAAVVKGSGIAALKKYDIVKQLEEACSSGGSSAKEGSLFAIELLSDRLGLLFEPYVIVLLPSLLKCFSDSSDHVRTAASNTAGIIMSKLSAHGVKLVMPAVLTAFNDPAWRTKQASIHMLGAMSHLAPKQLAAALPKVVPQLIEAFSDTHPKVKSSAQEALNEISTVVKNPEISSISSVLLKALTDPADYTTRALEVLIETEFLHSIDSPSLALIVPVLHRGLRDRGAATKRFGGLIAGNICTMINDPKDFVPYLSILLPDLQVALLDPIPDVRSTSAKALGSITRSLGDHVLPDLRPWLLTKLREESCSSAERSGAAQGLTEVLVASGSEMVDETMRQEILPLRSHPAAGTREGVLWMLTFLPPALGQGFTPLIDVALPALISGLSDDSEPVREAAMQAGRVLIRSHGKVHVDKILPSLEAGLEDDDHRIRVASLSLLGDLLSMIGGTQVVRGDGDTQDDIRRAERAQAQIALALGSETRKRILSGLYLARNDSVHMVRQNAIQVWKTVVSVTARALRDILPVLVSKIIDGLASGHEEQTNAAGRCLGDIVSKLGDSVLPQIIPVLRNALYQGDAHTKRGVCIGLTDVINCSTKDQILRFIEIIVKVVQDALSDEDESVRLMAAESFKALHAVVGNRALDEVVPSLMVALESESSDESIRARALNGLTGILSVRSRELLPYIIPRLIQRPITPNHAVALAGVADVTGSTIYFHFASIVPSILGELSDLLESDPKKEIIRNCGRSICRSVDEAGVNWLVSEIASKCGSDKFEMRRESCKLFEVFIIERAAKQDFYEQIPIILRELLYRLNDDNESVLNAANVAFSAVSSKVPAEELVKHVEFIRNLLLSMVSDARRRKGGVGDGEFLLPGFNIPKGLEPFIPIYQRGILHGTPMIREVSAAGLGEMIELTSSKFLAGPLIVKMTGPLLRIVGDRNPANVKVAILKTLGLVLVKGGPALRAFVPQFQTTFVKALSDPSRLVRVEAIKALSLLMPLSTRVDPLIKELVVGSLGRNINADGLAAAAVQTATLEALAAVLEHGGSKAKLPDSIPSALDASKELLIAADEGIRDAAAKVMGASCALSGIEVTMQVVRDEIIAKIDLDDSAARHGKACAIRRILVSEIGTQLGPSLDAVKELAVGLLSDDKGSVREAGWVALGAVVGRSKDPKGSLQSVEKQFLNVIADTRESMDIHRAVARGLCVALLMIEASKRIDFMGLKMLDACLKIALNGPQRIQFAFNDVLWLALDVESGEAGLETYVGMANFDNVRSMKSLHSKVLSRNKEISILRD